MKLQISEEQIKIKESLFGTSASIGKTLAALDNTHKRFVGLENEALKAEFMTNDFLS